MTLQALAGPTLARLGVRLTAREGVPRADASRLDLSDAARVWAARRVLAALAEREPALRISGAPPCVFPALHERVAGMPGLRRPAACAACRHARACAGPKPRGAEPVPDVLDEVAVDLTGACNLECGICLARELRRPALPAAEVRRVLGEAARAGVSTVRFTGGEPLLRRDLPELLGFAKGLGLRVFLNTNGTLLDDRALRALEGRVDSVLLSVQGHDAASEQRLTGGGTGFARKLRNLRALVLARIATVRVNTILSRTLLARGARYARLLEEAGVRRWIATRPVRFPASGPLAGEYGLSRAEFSRALSFLAGLSRRGLRANVGNGAPHCAASGGRERALLEANAISEGHSRVLFDARGRYRPTYEKDLDLGRTLAQALAHPYRRQLKALALVPAECRACALLKDCLGGNRAMAEAATGDAAGRDPFMRGAVRRA